MSAADKLLVILMFLAALIGGIVGGSVTIAFVTWLGV